MSPIDDVAVKNWESYSAARNEMLARTHTISAPWEIVRTDDKRAARLGVIKALLRSIDYKGRDGSLLVADPDVVFSYRAGEATHAEDQRLAP